MTITRSEGSTAGQGDAVCCPPGWRWARGGRPTSRGEVSTLARRLLTGEDLQEFSDNVMGEIRLHDATAAFLSREYRPVEGRPQRGCRDEAAAVCVQ